MKRAFVAFALALSACAAPSSYEGLSGGTKEDEAVAAPRPVSPVSVSFVASARPRLRWDLGNAAGSNLTGAIVEMSRTREFVDVKTFVAKGGELVVPEDLELGVWFWRLKGDAAGTRGTKPSVVWEMVVRGPAAHGSSDAPTRAMVDSNGDGEPDLLIGGTFDDGPVDPQAPIEGPSATPAGQPQRYLMPSIMYFPGGTDHGFGVATDYHSPYPSAYDGPISIGGGTDFDGDGITDMIEAGTDVEYYQGETFFTVGVLHSHAKQSGKLVFDYDRSGVLFLGQDAATVLPSVREAADVDGDGYGDSVVGLVGTGYVALGTASAPFDLSPNALPPSIVRPLVAVNPSYGRPGSTSRIAMGAFDSNGDGLADVAFSFVDEEAPKIRAIAAPGDRSHRVANAMTLDAPDARLATQLTAGDFNGDGLDDVAITTPIGDTNKVCLWFGNREKLLSAGPCIGTPSGETEFGASLTAADLEGDGVDELLLTSKSGGVDGVRVVRLAESGTTSIAPIGLPGVGVRLTTIWPGRPGKARWAAVAGDGSRVAVFEGAELRTSIAPPEGIVKGFGRGLR